MNEKGARPQIISVEKVMMSRKVWGLIPARLESSRLPHKALRVLHGLPMIVHVAKRSILAKELDEVIVCTDSAKIAQACLKNQVKVCITHSDCQNGTERILSAKRRIGIDNHDLIIDIQGDEPLVDPESINLVAKQTKLTINDVDIVLPHMESCPADNKNVVKVIASGNRVVYLSRADAPFPFNKDIQLKKHLSIIGFSGESLEEFGRLPMMDLEKIEGVELLRAVEGGMNIHTFPICADSFSVDVMDDFERAERALRTCPIFSAGY